MIVITMKDGTVKCYSGDSFTDYMYDKKCFIVLRGKQWIGIYNIDCVESVEFIDSEK